MADDIYLVSSRSQLANVSTQGEETQGRETNVTRSFLSLFFFRPPKAILVPGMYFLGFSRYSNCFGQGRLICQRIGVVTRVSSVHVMPFCLLASVYEKPATEPVLRPKRPCRLGPILLPSDSMTLWHWAHLVCYLDHQCRYGL